MVCAKCRENYRGQAVSSKNTLVTGGAGYIGSHVVLALQDAGHSVSVIDNLSTGHASAIPSDVPFLESDLSESEAVEAFMRLNKTTNVLHFAAHTQVGESVVDPEKYYRNNTFNTLKLVDACKRVGVERFIFSSTAAVYGEVGLEPVQETAAKMPVSPYGWSKLFSEQMISDMCRAHQMSWVALRYFNVAGADPQGRAGQSTPEATHLIKVACEVALGLRDSLKIFGSDYPTPDGTGVRDYIHVSDLADAHLAALEYLEAGAESLAVNCGYGRGYSVKQVLDVLAKIANGPVKTETVARRRGDAASVVANAGLIREKLDWRPVHNDLEHIITTAYRWEQRKTS